MSEPVRLLEEGASDVEAELLRSARWDAPPPGSRRKALVALGVGSASVLAGSSTAAASLGGASGTLAMVKWIAGGVVAGVLAVGAASRVSSAPSASSSPSATAGAPVVRAPPGHPSAAEVVGATEAPREEPSATATAPPMNAPAASTAGAVGVSVPVTGTATPPSLAEEVAAVDGAREALAAGDAERALRLLDERDRRFPGGAMGQEVRVLRIEAFAKRGDGATARRMAEAFLAKNPESPHASHLRTLLGLPPPAASAP